MTARNHLLLKTSLALLAAVVNGLAAPRIHPHGCGHYDFEAGDCDCPMCPHRSASRSLD
jgi:hypothetical protein